MASSSHDSEQLQLADDITSIIQKLYGSHLEVYMHAAVQDSISQGKVSCSDIERDINEALKTTGYKTELENAVYKESKKLSTKGNRDQLVTGEKVEGLSYVRKAQCNWEKRIAKSLNTMCTDLNIPLAKSRDDKSMQELSSHWTELGTLETDLSNIRPVYGPKDFLEVLVNVGMPGKNEDLVSQYWGMLNSPIHVRSLNELRLLFSDMAINQCQNGVDDEVEVPQEVFAQERFKMGKRVIADNSSSAAQEFCKKGCPASLRASLWKLILGVNVTNVDRLYYDQLKHAVLSYDLLTDLLYFKDIKLTATNDDQYFVFEDYVFQVLLPFTRDTRVLELVDSGAITPSKSYIRGKLGVPEYSVVYPPNGVIPFYGFAMFDIFSGPSIRYFTGRSLGPEEMYTQYFHKLHIISSDKQSILGLAVLFESLLQSQEPQLFFHLHNNDIHPLKIVFKWLMRAFSGYLSSNENLLLWDKILSYDSLEILPVLAVAILSFRKLNLLQVKTQSQAEAVLADLTTIKVMPLLQLSLFSK